jgi:nicotinate-nucleotide pyrophosphorylase (carboxylating)
MIEDMDTFELLVNNLVNESLKEDLSQGDITTEILIPSTDTGKAIIKAKAEGILAGTRIASIVLKKVDKSLKVEFSRNDGDVISNGDIIANIEGRLSSILKAERLTLNFLQHLSGVATLTSTYVKAVEGLQVKIADTRKTIPGMRILEKQAVVAGGGINHRMNLGDSILIKNNHITTCIKHGMSLTSIIKKAKQQTHFPSKTIEIEVTTIDQAVEAVEAGADIVMLDNMSIDEMQKAVGLINRRAIVEASGGINRENVRQIAQTGVDIISIGALTHSARALDISLNIL